MTDSTESLTERIRGRVDVARVAVDRRANATRPQIGSRAGRPADSAWNDEEEARIAQSLKRVFRDLGVTYRRYHRQVGGPVAPGLRDANYKFRERPSFDSLVVVAGYLDGLKLLD
jgi:hypothetical protein